MVAAKYAKSPGIVKALVKGKADVNAKNKVRHLEDKSVCRMYTHGALVCVRCRTATLLCC